MVNDFHCMSFSIYYHKEFVTKEMQILSLFGALTTNFLGSVVNIGKGGWNGVSPNMHHGNDSKKWLTSSRYVVGEGYSWQGTDVTHLRMQDQTTPWSLLNNKNHWLGRNESSSNLLEWPTVIMACMVLSVCLSCFFLCWSQLSTYLVHCALSLSTKLMIAMMSGAVMNCCWPESFKQ